MSKSESKSGSGSVCNGRAWAMSKAAAKSPWESCPASLWASVHRTVYPRLILSLQGGTTFPLTHSPSAYPSGHMWERRLGAMLGLWGNCFFFVLARTHKEAQGGIDSPYQCVQGKRSRWQDRCAGAPCDPSAHMLCLATSLYICILIELGSSIQSLASYVYFLNKMYSLDTCKSEY